MAYMNHYQQNSYSQARRSNIKDVKDLLGKSEMKARLAELLGKKSTQFSASIVNAVSTNSKLQEVDASTVMQAALIAAAYDLPIDGNLGFAAIVPYKGKAQFQMMYKGFIQLAIRSGQYSSMNCAEVYEDEFSSYNPITGEIYFVEDFSKTVQRDNGEFDKIIGYYAWFSMKNGFSHQLFMSKRQVANHAAKYSQSYQYDLEKGKKSSRWSQDFDAMAKKTVIKQLLSKWGILSIEMQNAINDDQKVFESDGSSAYADNAMAVQQGKSDAVLNVFEEKPEQAEQSVISAQVESQPMTEAQFTEDADFIMAEAETLPWN